MNKKIVFFGIVALLLVSISWMLPQDVKQSDNATERTKIVLREVGNQLLLSQQDSTSLVLPVLQLEEDTYVLAFQNELSFLPTTLVSLARENFEKAGLSNNYIIELYQCTDNEVAYSFEIRDTEEKTLVPCIGRELPLHCYRIKVQFMEDDAKATISTIPIKAGLLFAAGGIFIFMAVRFRESGKGLVPVNDDYTTLGVYRFYPLQNKLVKAAEELPLSKKECELLALLVAQPNQVIKREDLTKKVWEDNGVFVGRSLDTYISKLRKKLQDDDTIRITNVHGVGYKLEIKE